MIKNGISEENLMKLFTHAQIGPKEQDMVRNLSFLGINIVSDVSAHRHSIVSIFPKTKQNIFRLTTGQPKENLHRTTKRAHHRTHLSNVQMDTGHQRHYGRLHWRQAGCTTFPILGWTCSEYSLSCADKVNLIFSLSHNIHLNAILFPHNSSARYGHWHKDKAQTAIKNVPRVIVFVVGGASFSEMRCAYEVTAQTKNWEIIVGSSHILTPEIFLSDLGSLSKED